jgi:NADPH:quinone reductase-like Zn-dependent oxidoreductase
MKAIRLHTRGGAGQLVFESAPMPVLREGDALVKVLASGITRNELNWEPTYTNEKGKSRLPAIPGHELCGVVEQLMPGIREFAPGDWVYALTSFFRDGAAADYIAVSAAELAPKPRTLGPTEAAAVPLSALTAWQALFDHGGLHTGQHVLIHGAAGSVGTFAIQIARWRGVRVIATCAAKNFDLVRKLGADLVFDFHTFPYDEYWHKIDLVVDPIGADTQDRSWPLLKPGGTLVSIAGESIRVPENDHGWRGVFFIVKPDRDQLIEIGRLIDEKYLRPVISGVFPLEKAGQAFAALLKPEKPGKIVLQIA